MKTIRKVMLGAAAVAMAWGAFWSVEACAEAESVTIGLLLGATLCVLKLTGANAQGTAAVDTDKQQKRWQTAEALERWMDASEAYATGTDDDKHSA